MKIKKNGNPLIPYTEQRLDSGITLVHKEVRMAPIVAIDFWINTGAVHDPEAHLGLSHFYEHMFFKGTAKHETGKMDQIITGLGGYNNAATSLDYTHYYVVLPRMGCMQALDVMVDSLLNPLFDPDEIERERQVIFEEIKRSDDNPWSKIYDEFTNAAFKKCPYHRRVLGTDETLKTITQETFFDYLNHRYTPNNITIAVVGDIALDEISEYLNTAFEGVSSKPPIEPEHIWGTINSPEDFSILADVNQAYLLIGYPTPKLIGSKHEYALDLLAMIFGEGRSSRLHKRLNDELGIVSSIGCTFWNLARAGLLMIEAVTEPSKVKQVEEEIENEMKKLRERITIDELHKCKSMTRADFAFSNEKVISVAQSYGYGKIIAGIDYVVNYQHELEKTTLADLEIVFDHYLIPSRRCKGLLLPK